MTQQQIQPLIPKALFCRDYLPDQQAVALAVLPEGDRSLAEWQQLWRQALQSPA